MSILSKSIIITIRQIGPGKEKVSSPSVLVNPILSFYLPPNLFYFYIKTSSIAIIAKMICTYWLVLKGLQRRPQTAEGKVRNILPGRQGTVKIINQGSSPENKEEERKSKEEGNVYLIQKAFSNMGKGKSCQTEITTAFPRGWLKG